jgi:hypothetical protein
MGLVSFTVGVSFARTRLAEVSGKVAELEALGWRELGRGDPWAASFRKSVPEEDGDPTAEVRAVMGDAWMDDGEMRALLEAARSPLLDSLITQYGRGAVVTVSPDTPDSGDTVRWVVQIDGVEERRVDVRVDRDPGDPETTVATLVRGSETLELMRWKSGADPAGIVDTLGGILGRQRSHP